jgi:rhomboid protease GluP
MGNRILRIPYEEFEERVRSGEIHSRCLIRFEVVTGEEFLPAGDLEFFQALSDPRLMQFRRNLTRPGMPILTAILVGVQTRIYLSSYMDGAEKELQNRFANWAPSILELGESWRLFTYGLLHLNFTHLLFNMCFLAYTGYHLERAMGRLNLAILFSASVFFGGLLSLFLSPDNPSLGASGGDFGLMAAAVVMGWKYGDTIPRNARKFFGWALLPYLGFSIISGLMGSNVDNWSHLGGLVSGAALMTLLDPEVLPRSRSRNRLIRRVSCGVILAISLGLFLARNRLVPLEQEEDVHGWVYSVPTYWNQGWTARNEPAWFSPTGQIEVSHSVRVHYRPSGAVEATNTMIYRLQADSQELKLTSRDAAQRGDWQGEQIVLDQVYRGQNERIVCLILVRGLYEYQTLIRMRGDMAPDYELLVDRLIETVDLTEPSRLARARESRSAAPDSWTTGLELALALHRAGHPHQAMGIWSEVLEQQPHSEEALAGWLETQIAYELDDREESAELALMRSPGEPDVVVLAAEIFMNTNRRRDAQAVLEEAWELTAEVGTGVGDERVEQAMKRWDMDVPDAIID